MRSAYLHVLADAATSVLAIVALFGGLLWGAAWLDPVMGLVGAALVAIWAVGLLRDSGRILLDAEMDAPVVAEVREVIERGAVPAKITDLHVWRVGRAKYAVVLSITTPSHEGSEFFRRASRRARGTRARHRGSGACPGSRASARAVVAARRARVSFGAMKTPVMMKMAVAAATAFLCVVGGLRRCVDARAARRRALLGRRARSRGRRHGRAARGKPGPSTCRRIRRRQLPQGRFETRWPWRLSTGSPAAVATDRRSKFLGEVAGRRQCPSAHVRRRCGISASRRSHARR